MTPTEAKAAERKIAFAARKVACTPDAQARIGAALVEAVGQYADKPLAGYLPIRSEADPRPAMAAHAQRSQVGVPVVLGPGQALEFRCWEEGAFLEEGAFGVMVPSDAKVMRPEVVIVPMVAFDARGYRLGYGGGFYDRTLQTLRAGPGVIAIGLAFSAQEVSGLTVEATDQRLDAVVTEAGLRRF